MDPELDSADEIRDLVLHVLQGHTQLALRHQRDAVSPNVEDAAKPEERHGPFGGFLVAVVPVYRVASAKDADAALRDLGSVPLGELCGDEGIALDDEISLKAVMGLLAACVISGAGHLR